jgi:tRNA threonylcarbamoyladenosine biosynthesis protein TsaE
MYKATSYSLEETKKFAHLVLKEVLNNKEKITNGGEKKATVLVLKGDLGSGKTAFTKCIGEILDVDGEITSPTFSIEKRYKIHVDHNSSEYKDTIETCGLETLIHIDAFRLESGKEILAIDFEETLKDPKNLICFEWPEMVSDIDILPKNAPIVEFEFVDENTRKMYFSPSQNTMELQGEEDSATN